MTENYEQELKLIDGATDGPWFRQDNEILQDKSGEWISQCWNKYEENMVNASNNAEYIAHFNPAHMRQRIEREMEKDAKILELEDMLSECEKAYSGLKAVVAEMAIEHEGMF